VLKQILVLVALLVLTGCGAKDEPIKPDTYSQPPLAAATSAAAIEQPPATNRDTKSRAKAQQSARTAQVQNYMQQATAAAQLRHRTATKACADHPEPQMCGEAVDEGLQSDLRAARVQFDEQMTELARQQEIE